VDEEKASRCCPSSAMPIVEFNCNLACRLARMHQVFARECPGCNPNSRPVASKVEPMFVEEKKDIVCDSRYANKSTLRPMLNAARLCFDPSVIRHSLVHTFLTQNVGNNACDAQLLYPCPCCWNISSRYCNNQHSCERMGVSWKMMRLISLLRLLRR